MGFCRKWSFLVFVLLAAGCSFIGQRSDFGKNQSGGGNNGGNPGGTTTTISTGTPDMSSAAHWFPSDMYFNQSVASLSLDSTTQGYSDAVIRSFVSNGGFGGSGIQSLGIGNEGTGGLQIGIGIDVFYTSSPTSWLPWDGTNLGLVYSPDSDTFLAQVPAPANGGAAGFESGSGTTCDGGDCHYLVMDLTYNRLIESYQSSESGGKFLTGVRAASDFGGLAIWPFSPPGGYPVNLRGDICTSADAGGLTIAPMLVTVEEVAAALDPNKPVPINHAIRLILPNSRIANSQYVRPATHSTGGSGWASATAGVPYGARFRLKSSSAVQAKINAMNPVAQVIAVALQNYGMILADGGGVAFTFKSDTYSTLKWANYPYFDSHAMFETAASALVPTDFDIVNITSPSQYLNMSGSCTRNDLGMPN